MTLRPARWMTQIALVGVMIGTAAEPALAEYLIRPGDTLEVAVAGIPDLKRRSVVDLDGLVTLPMIKPVAVGGLDLTAAQAAVKEELSKKLYQQHTPAGAESITAITPDAVSVSIVEYRPVYLNGDVSKPGEHAYRPGMTDRKSVV